MAFKNKSNKLPTQENLPIAQLIDVTTNALIKLITTGTSTVIALGILVILTATVLKADSDVQQQILPLLTGLLGVIIGRMLTQEGTSPPEPAELLDPPE